MGLRDRTKSMKSVFAIAALCFAVSLHFESAQADPYISEMEHDLNTVKADLEQLLQGAKVLGEDDDAGRRGGKKGFLSTAGSFTLSSGANQQVHAALKATNKAISAVHKAKKSKSSSCPKCVCGSKKAAKKPAKKKKFSLFKRKGAKKKPAKKKPAKKK